MNYTIHPSDTFIEKCFFQLLLTNCEWKLHWKRAKLHRYFVHRFTKSIIDVHEKEEKIFWWFQGLYIASCTFQQQIWTKQQCPACEIFSFFVLLLNDSVTTVFMITWTTKSEWYDRYNMCSSLLYTIRLVFTGYRTKNNQDVHTSALNNITTLLFWCMVDLHALILRSRHLFSPSPPYVVNFTFHNDWLILAGNLRVIITLQ